MRKKHQIRTGYHACSLYLTKEECLYLAERFLGSGLEQGDKCIVLADGWVARELRSRLGGDRAEGKRQARPQLELSSASGLSPDAEPAKSTWRNQVVAALDDGFSKARIVVIPAEAYANTNANSSLVEIESGFNTLVGKLPVAVYCLYDMASTRSSLLLNLLPMHPSIVVGDRICRNPYYMPAEELSLPPRERAQKQIERCLCEALENEQLEEELSRNSTELERRRTQIAGLQVLLEKALSVNQEIRKPLEYMLSSASFLKSNLKSNRLRCDGRIAPHIEAILGAADRIRQAVQELATVATPGRPPCAAGGGRRIYGLQDIQRT